MTKQKKLRHAEYYDMQSILDELYAESKDNNMGVRTYSWTPKGVK